LGKAIIEHVQECLGSCTYLRLVETRRRLVLWRVRTVSSIRA